MNFFLIFFYFVRNRAPLDPEKKAGRRRPSGVGFSQEKNPLGRGRRNNRGALGNHFE